MMKLGAFSISLAVKDIALSRAFYEKLGFTKFHGEEEQKWLILKNGETVIGLFEGMFPRNMLTFNPGWDQDAQDLDDFDDVRAIQQSLLDAGVTLDSKAEGAAGPASIMLTDPDGNPILIDQHR
jgi:catechol 2,3-dioxygenase-like lactoylglutathione lyase family enzyme